MNLVFRSRWKSFFRIGGSWTGGGVDTPENPPLTSATTLREGLERARTEADLQKQTKGTKKEGAGVLRPELFGSGAFPTESLVPSLPWLPSVKCISAVGFKTGSFWTISGPFFDFDRCSFASRHGTRRINGVAQPLLHPGGMPDSPHRTPDLAPRRGATSYHA